MQLKQQAPLEPPKWEELDPIKVSPRPKKNPALNIELSPEFRAFNTTLWIEAGHDDDTPDDTPVPTHKPPPAPPQCLPNNTATDPSLFNNLAVKYYSQVMEAVAIVRALN